ncbi:MAG TPA: phospholipase D-like domain-containing protein [Actinocatenispora sp.]
MRGRVIAAAALLAALVLPGAAPAAAHPPRHHPQPHAAPIATGAVFNDPYGDTAAQDAVKDHILGAIANTQPGRLIRTSMYALTDQDYTDALVAAHDRGVQIRVVLDAKFSTSAPAQNLITALGTDMSTTSWVRVCHEGGACIAYGGVNPINHNKFFLFSRIGDPGVAEDVVIQASANATALNTEKYFNNAYTVVGNTDLYTAYVSYFNDLAAMVGNNNYFRSGKVGAEKYYFFPQETGDVVVDILHNVSCTGNSTVGTPGDHRSIVRVSAYALHRAEVADALVALAGQGCQVDIVYTDSNQEANLVGHDNLSLRHLKADGYLVHSKYFLVEGNYAGHPDTKWVWTGSHNLDFSSLRENDETLLRIEGASAHDAYRANFEHMQTVAVPMS